MWWKNKKFVTTKNSPKGLIEMQRQKNSQTVDLQEHKKAAPTGFEPVFQP